MSLRGTKRATGMRGEETGASKRRRTDPEDALWQLRPVSDLKMSSIYNRSASEAPAELFRKDLISAMKLPDSEPLTSSEYWIITDTWKQDWERGVQVPVNPDSLPAPKVKIINNALPPDFQEFKLPKDKYIHLARDAHYQPDKHLLSTTPARAEAACNYDLDAIDTAWLKLLNAERARAGAPPVSEDQLEKVIEELEVRTWDKIQAIMKSEEGLGIEYDENVICDVCRSPDSEDGNEMVFCDSCNICVHQACYGITVIPDGQWLCRPCGDGVRPTCVLCPNLGGAMKCTPSGHKWAHVSCVLWIPEVSIGCAEKMEPITKISSIPASRWSLVCVLCRERKGACIQCSVKTCKTAYHVTCAFKHGLEMRAIIEDENADDGVKLRSYCQKHSVNSKKEKSSGSGSEEEEIKRKRRKDMTSEEKSQARTARLQEIEREFDRHVSVKDISTHLLDVDQDAINYIYNYWKLKRRAGHNRPLLPPKSDDSELLTHRQEQADLDKMKMFVQLRQDLERVRNLCYMVSRREKLSRSFFRMREQTFHKQVAVLSEDQTISGPDLAAIIEANHGPSIYDRLYSHPNAPDHKNDFDDLLARIAPPESSDEKKKDRNGLIKGSKLSNPYKKHYVNGSRRSGSMYSGLSSEESAADLNRSSRYRRTIGSSTDEDDKKPCMSPKKKVSPKIKGKRSPKKTDKKKKKTPQSKALIESSSEDDDKSRKIKKDRSHSKTLQQMEKEMAAGKTGHSGTDSGDLIPIKTTRNNKFTVDIYSDSSDDFPTKIELKCDKKSDKVKAEKIKSDKIKPESSPNENDSQQQLPRTKAAMKEFIPELEKKSPVKVEKPAPKKRGRKPSNKERMPVKIPESDDEAKNKENMKITQQKDNTTDLIVPQRQAAKKASENMRSTTIAKKEEINTEKQASGDDSKSKPKVKAKGKELKEKEIKDKEIKDEEIKDKEGSLKVGRKKSKDVDKETISYVPQRQAAKKAAAHIKSGLGNKVTVPENADSEKKKEIEKSEPTKSSPKKETAKVSKTSQKESSTSSSNSSSSVYSTSSSSEEEQDKPEIKPTAKAREIKLVTRQPSLFSPPGPRPTVDLPFLDKVSRPLSSTSASSDSESSRSSRYSGSSSPYAKRPRRRRKAKSVSTDISPRKAPDKKLKTSERRSECGVSSPTVEREESGGSNDTRAATRARTRSTTTIGNTTSNSDAMHRKSSKEDVKYAYGSNKDFKEGSQSSKLPTPEWKENEEIKKETEDETVFEPIKNSIKSPCSKSTKRSISIEDKDMTKTNEAELSVKSSPIKSIDIKQKSLLNRRMSVKDPMPKETKVINEELYEPVTKHRRLSKQDSQKTSDIDNSLTPLKKSSSIDMLPFKHTEKKTVPPIINDYADNDKDWLPKAPSPNINLPAVEKPGGHEKYMTEDKSLDSDSADKSSTKMIARIQANLNENTMIKSPKTPMDARMISIDTIDIDKPLARNVRMNSLMDTDKKFITQDTSHVQGVEISKSAKIPSATHQFPTLSVFSPQPKENDHFGLDMLAVDDGFNHDDLKPFTEFLFKEDTKEQGVQETRDLVDRLRMTLKKLPTGNSDAKEDSLCTTDEKENKEEIDAASKSATSEHSTSPAHNDAIDYNRPVNEPKGTHDDVHHLPHTAAATIISPRVASVESKDENQIVSLISGNKWSHMPVANNHPHIEKLVEKHYNDYTEIKEPTNLLSDIQSETGDAISLSKQSDDSESLSVVDHSTQSIDHEVSQDNQTYDNNNSQIHSDCATIASPAYVSEDSKWRESKITTRRSSASSTDSEDSVCSQKQELKSPLNSCDSQQANLMPDIDSYPPITPYPCAIETPMSLNQYTNYIPDTPPYISAIGSMSLFPTSASMSMPLQSPGPGLYISYASKPHLLPIQKPPLQLGAAFTSSSQNIALTTAMIAPPTPKPVDTSCDDIDVSGSDKYSIHVVSSPNTDSYNDTSCSRDIMKVSSDSTEVIKNQSVQQSQHSQESKSPTKPCKLINKFPGKSPAKSPGISPKQSEHVKGSKRTNNRNNRTQRGRGRSKSRGHGFPIDYMDNSIQSKLVGTVYDFDEEIANDDVDLKALRERRKSIDIRDDRKSEHSFKEASNSPQVISPHRNNKVPVTEIKGVQPPLTPESRKHVESPSSKGSSERGPGFTQVQAVLPGPVDMRTYQPFENPAPAATDGFHSHLLAFASGTAEQPLAEIDEEVEKQLHSALMASKVASGLPSVAQASNINGPPKEPSTPQLLKASLSDSRNQLKVKIKGPFLDANYSTSVAQPVVPQPPVPVHDTNTNVLNAGIACTSSMMTGSTNLRRMRKKELLRQYWTQDMNMDEPTNTTIIGVAPPPAAPTPLARTVITIPKAVASMTNIPTREDYKITTTPVEKKKRKVSSGLSRELRHLEVSMNDDVEQADEIKLPTYTDTASQVHKRRGRVSTKSNKVSVSTPGTPKLKIKIGSNIVQPVNEEPSGFQFRPPKKRYPSIPKPTFEDLRRESMKYRRKVMADFEENEKTEKHKPNRIEKRKKKKDKKVEKEKLRVINSESESATKLIIKIKRTKDDQVSNTVEESGASTSGGGAMAASEPIVPADPFDYDPSAPDPLAIDPPSYSGASSAMRKIRTAKVTPIRLKLARSSQGSGYVMKGSSEEGAQPAPASSSQPLPLAVNKHCEVR